MTARERWTRTRFLNPSLGLPLSEVRTKASAPQKWPDSCPLKPGEISCRRSASRPGNFRPPKRSASPSMAGRWKSRRSGVRSGFLQQQTHRRRAPDSRLLVRDDVPRIRFPIFILFKPMSLSRHLTIASAVLTLASCSGIGGGRIDASYPTTAELDSMDTQWGLPPRKSRGAPKRSYQYSAPAATYGSSAAPAAAAPAAPPRETVNTPPPAGAAPAADPATINSLR